MMMIMMKKNDWFSNSVSTQVHIKYPGFIAYHNKTIQSTIHNNFCNETDTFRSLPQLAANMQHCFKRCWRQIP